MLSGCTKLRNHLPHSARVLFRAQGIGVKEAVLHLLSHSCREFGYPVFRPYLSFCICAFEFEMNGRDVLEPFLETWLDKALGKASECYRWQDHSTFRIHAAVVRPYSVVMLA